MTEPSSAPQTVRLHYVKSPQFRSIHVDGAVGGVAPSGHINVALYAERIPIPTSQVFDLVDGQLGPERTAERAGRDGVLRELEVNLVLNVEAARALHGWLDQAIKNLDARIGEKKGEANA